MTPEEIQAYKEQVFDQSSIQSQNQNNVPDTTAQAETVETTTTENTATETTAADISTTTQTETSDSNEEIVDGNEYLKNNLGYDDWEVAKAEIAQLKQFKETAPKEIEFANEESKQAFELLKSGNLKEVKKILELQERLEDVSNMSAEEAIKFDISQKNKHFKKADIEDVFEEKYTYPDKPVQSDLEDDTDFASRTEKWQSQVDKINRRLERDAVTAKEDLAKLKTEIKFPEIQKDTNPELEAFKTYQENISQAQEDNKKLVESLSKISEKDVSFQLPFNDEANKMKFDISYTGDKEGVNKAKEAVANYMDFLSQTYYTEDGSPLTDKLTSDIYFLQNKEKFVTEAVKQAVNQTKIWMLRNQKNIGDGTQRNMNVVQPSIVDYLRENVFSK